MGQRKKERGDDDCVAMSYVAMCFVCCAKFSYKIALFLEKKMHM